MGSLHQVRLRAALSSPSLRRLLARADPPRALFRRAVPPHHRPSRDGRLVGMARRRQGQEQGGRGKVAATELARSLCASLLILPCLCMHYGALGCARALLEAWTYGIRSRAAALTLPPPFSQLAGLLAGQTVCFVACPTEHLKARLQMQTTGPKLYTGPIDCVRKVVAAKGFFGLWHGLTGTLLFRSWMGVMCVALSPSLCSPLGRTPRLTPRLVTSPTPAGSSRTRSSSVGSTSTLPT